MLDRVEGVQGDMDWSYLDEDRKQRRALMNAIMTLEVHTILGCSCVTVQLVLPPPLREELRCKELLS